MRFGEVDIPQEMIDARREGKLAVFAGAGVSVGSPSNLPGFDGLVKCVAEGTPGVDLQDRKKKRFDRFLGELHRGGAGVNVHEIVHRELDRLESEPTPLHYELLQLFEGASDVRVVTTNFDPHFTTAARELFEDEVPHCYAPALPPGDDFSGIAYLHGSLEQHPEQLILTDEDFSRAYLTQGWARRFLQRLFSSFYVLFVGYSHGDAVIEYLARGIPATSDQGRFALDKGWKRPDEEPTNWEYFGIQPIYYPRAGEENEYAELPKALKRWNQYALQTARERAEHIEILVEQGPSELNDQQEDALRDRLRSLDGVRHFANAASAPPWLYWAFSEGFLDTLFQPGSLSEVEGYFARWVANALVRQHPESALALIGPRARQLNPFFWNRIARSLWQNADSGELSSEQLATWIQVLLVSPPANPHNLTLLLSDGLRMPEDRRVALLLLGYLTEPIINIRQGFTLDSGNPGDVDPSFRTDVILRDEDAQIRRAWEQVVQPHIADIAEEVETIATANIRRLHQLYASAGRTYADDETPLSMSRSAIEPHSQDEHSLHDATHALINMARDTGEWLIVNRPEWGKSTVKRWSESRMPLLQRLAVHVTTEDPHTDSNESLRWLLDRDWIYVRFLKHEVFRLLSRAYPQAEEETRREVLKRIWERWPDEEVDDRRSKAYPVYNIVQWLAAHAEDCSLAQDRLEAIENEFPDFEPRDHPDLDSWVGTFRAVQPEDYSEELLRRRPNDQLDELIQILEGGWFPRQEDSADTDDVQRAIAQEFDWGFELMEALVEREIWGEELWKPLWRGMTETPLDESDWGELLTFVMGHQSLHSHVRGVARLLEERSKPNQGDLPLEHLEVAEQVAEAVFDEAQDEPITVGGDADLATQLLNHPGATLTIFFLHALWIRQDADDLSSLPEEYRDRFSAILESEHRAAQAGKMILGSRIGFLHHLDPGWAREHLLPLFGWTDEEKARSVWTGLLFMGQSVNPALAQEMREESRKAFSEIAGESDDFRRRFAGFIASLAVSDAVDPLEESWLSQYLADAEEDRVLWANQMRNRLRKLDSNRVEEVWNDWLRDFWRLRLDGKPPLTAEEEAAALEWTPALEPVIREAVELYCQGPAPRFGQHTQLLFSIKNQNVGQQHPQAITRLLLFSLGEGEGLRWSTHFVPDIVEQIASAENCPEEDFHSLTELCVERGYIEAGEVGELLNEC